MFGPDVASEFLDKIGVQTLIRGHEPCDEGYKWKPTKKESNIFAVHLLELSKELWINEIQEEKKTWFDR